MPESKKKDKRVGKVFIDSSIVIAAVLSPSGGSFRLIRESLFKNYTLLISDYVLEESIRILKTKFPEKTYILPILLENFRFKMTKDPSEKEVEKLIDIIDFKDAPILAAVIKYKTDYLITLDKKHFLNQKVLEFARDKKISILTPKEFLGILK
jgi:putative PIN family toxin of toxin-antitoxin system